MSTFRVSCASLTLSLTVVCAAPPAAAEASDAIDRARELFRSFEYDEAVEVLEDVVTDPTGTAVSRVQAYELIGAIRVLQNRQEPAREAFSRLLALDPGHQIDDPDIPPRVTKLFRAVHDGGVEPAAPALDLRVPPDPPADERLDLEVVASGDAEGVATIVVFARRAASESFEPHEARREGDAYVVAVEPLGEATLEVYVEARAPSGHVLARLATADEPRTIEAEAPRAEAPPEVVEPATRPWYRRWWVWTIVGAVVAGGAVTGIVLGTRPEEHQDGTLGSVTMPLGR
jgi:hypothetical protein